jgi:hypothetical protein
MTFFGELLGYDSQGDDLLGENLDPANNCPACGISCMKHSPQMEAECMKRIFGAGEQGETKP